MPRAAIAGTRRAGIAAAAKVVCDRDAMSDDHHEPEERDETLKVEPADGDAEDRAAILNRRAVFIASAIAGLSLITCGPNTEPQPCLDMAVGGTAGAGGVGGEPQPCLTMRPTTSAGGAGGEPQPCLGMGAGGAGGGGMGGAGGMGGMGGAAGSPQPCLDMPPPGGAGGTGMGGSGGAGGG
jgi:hypothetical protein